MSLFVTGEGSISAAGIILALNCEPWIEKSDYGIYTRKLIVYLNTAIEATANKDK